MIDGVNPSGQGLAGPFGAADASGVAAELPPSLTLDADAYLPMLAEFDLTEAQARELLAVLWNTMRGFVELGLSIDVCGELGLTVLPVLSSETGGVDSNDRPIPREKKGKVTP